MTDRVFTMGLWTTRPGQEEDFVARWERLARWASEEFPQACAPTLLRDRDEPQRFVSFSGWPGIADADGFRGHPRFGELFGQVREVVDGFEPRTLDAVVDPGAPDV